ncbi:hypothetical protein C8J57DRAFT_1232793 [Mycena rebaudengoi]|nr:hypothetical protein C8J57DRAFT_1232793 [Mycena rebaudengoi]
MVTAAAWRRSLGTKCTTTIVATHTGEKMESKGEDSQRLRHNAASSVSLVQPHKLEQFVSALTRCVDGGLHRTMVSPAYHHHRCDALGEKGEQGRKVTKAESLLVGAVVVKKRHENRLMETGRESVTSVTVSEKASSGDQEHKKFNCMAPCGPQTQSQVEESIWNQKPLSFILVNMASCCFLPNCSSPVRHAVYAAVYTDCHQRNFLYNKHLGQGGVISEVQGGAASNFPLRDHQLHFRIFRRGSATVKSDSTSVQRLQCVPTVFCYQFSGRLKKTLLEYHSSMSVVQPKVSHAEWCEVLGIFSDASFDAKGDKPQLRDAIFLTWG